MNFLLPEFYSLEKYQTCIITHSCKDLKLFTVLIFPSECAHTKCFKLLSSFFKGNQSLHVVGHLPEECSKCLYRQCQQVSTHPLWPAFTSFRFHGGQASSTTFVQSRLTQLMNSNNPIKFFSFHIFESCVKLSHFNPM